MQSRQRTAGTALPARSALLQTLCTPEALVLLSSLIALAVIFPLRETPLAAPAVRFFSTLTLFVAPGVLVSRLCLGGHFSGAARIPMAFALSISMFGLLGLPALILHRSLQEYLWACSAVISLTWIFAVFLIVRSKTPDERGTFPSKSWLWLPFVGLFGVLAAVSTRTVRRPAEDVWLYLAYVQDFIERNPLGSYVVYSDEASTISRYTLNSWLLEQAALSHVASLDATGLVLEYLPPTLVLVSLLAFYGLASMLFESRTAALFSACLYALFFLINLDSVRLAAGGEFVGRVVEDKFVARFVFLPVALGLALLFLRERRLLHLGLFLVVYLSAGVVHPLGPVIIGICVLGFGLLHLAVSWRHRRSRASVGLLGMALFSIVLPPALYLLATGTPLPSYTDVGSARDAFAMYSAEKQKRLLTFGEGAYIMHPSLLLDPFLAAGYLLGVPFLFWQLKRVSAQLLLGMLLFVPILIYVPPVAMLVGNVVGPWHLWRLAWPIPLAALLTLSWMSWELLVYARTMLERFEGLKKLAPPLPLICVTLLLVGATPWATAGVSTSERLGEVIQTESYCHDPTFYWLQSAVPDPGVVLAPDAESNCVTAHVALASVVSYRSRNISDSPPEPEQLSPEEDRAARLAADVKRFFDATAIDAEMVNILRRYKVDHVLLPVNSPLHVQLENSPGISALDNPGERYQLYEIDRNKLEATPALKANGYLNSRDWRLAISAYSEALGGNENERLLAYVGLGYAYEALASRADAVESYEQAVALRPDRPYLYALLAQAHAANQDHASARTALEQAVSLNPRNVLLRFKLGNQLLTMREREEAVTQYRAVVQLFPQVPFYRLKLGALLSNTGDRESGAREFERAVSLEPLSAGLYWQAGQMAEKSGQPGLAAKYYERASDLDPDNERYAKALRPT